MISLCSVSLLLLESFFPIHFIEILKYRRIQKPDSFELLAEN